MALDIVKMVLNLVDLDGSIIDVLPEVMIFQGNVFSPW